MSDSIISTVNAEKETPQSDFLSVSFEQLSEVAVSLPESSPERVELNQQEAGKVTSVEKTVDFLSLPFEQLMRVSVHVAVFLDNDQEADKKTEAEVTSEGSGFSSDTLSVFSKQSQQGVAPIVPEVQSEPNDIKDNTTTTTTTTTTLPPPVPMTTPNGTSIIPLVIPEFLVISNLLDSTISILINNRNGTFSVLLPFPVSGLVPLSIATGDFNGDGILDLAAANSFTDNIDIFLGISTGIFGPSTNIAGVNSPGFIVTADFNGDGILDLACTNQNTNTISIFLGLGNGTFGAPTMIPTPGPSPYDLILGDFNADGIVDLAVVNTNGSMVAIFIGSGTGSFNLITNVLSGGQSTILVTGDFNGDGLLDLAMSNTNSGSISVLLGTGMGFFGFPTVYSQFTSPFFVTTGDFNKDGNLDLVTGDVADGRLYILFGDGTGAFSQKVAIASGGLWSYGSVADFNGDGNLDLAVTDGGGNLVAIFLGKGDGTFQTPISYPVGSGPQFVGFGILPAGVSGCPINLALSIPNTAIDNISLMIKNIPSDWVLNTEMGNLKELTIITPQNFVGARVLCIDMSWIASDGSLQHLTIMDNIEAYAPGSPIFALPGDNLTGSSYADTFVISKSNPLVQDTVFSFDILEDKINLLDFTGIQQFSDLNIQNDNKGNALVSLDSGDHRILLYGVNPENLSENNFLFNETSYTLNNHIIDIGQGAIMPFSGIFENNGTIRVDGTMVMQGELVGSGKIILGDCGVLEFNGYFNQDIVFETGSTSIVFDHMEFTLAHMTTISLQTLLEGHSIVS